MPGFARHPGFFFVPRIDIRSRHAIIVSMTQHEITSPIELLDDTGHLVEEGWARQPLWRYDRGRVKAPWYRIKEWDYYCILSQKREYGIAVTVSDLGYAALTSIVWLDFAGRRFEPVDSIKLLTRGKLGFPASSVAGDLEYEDAKMSIRYAVGSDERRIVANCPGFGGSDTNRAPGARDGADSGSAAGRGLRCDLVLRQDKTADTMTIATSWKENRRAFYYNQKINCMPVSGTVEIGDERHSFEPDDSFGVLDWGRGYWLYKNRWYWGSASGVNDGKLLGWNIGYGFTDRTPASENVVFYDGRAHKLDEVIFHIDETDYLAPWKFTSNDGRFEMDFQPILDRHSAMNLGVISSIQNQVFGYYSGNIVLDGGQTIKVDRMLGFAEDVRNRW